MFDWTSPAMPIFVNHISTYYSVLESDCPQRLNAIERLFNNHLLQESGCGGGRRGVVEGVLDSDHCHHPMEYALTVSGQRRATVNR